MFLYEIDKAYELLKTYRSSEIKKELFVEAWMNGEYESLVPDILFQLIHAARFMEYMSYALRNDECSISSRVEDIESVRDLYGYDPEPYYKSVFDNLTRRLALHLIHQKDNIYVDRDELVEGIWNPGTFYNFLSLNRLMSTMCLLCEEVFQNYYVKYDDERERSLEEKIDPSWLEDDEALTYANWDIEDAIMHLDRFLEDNGDLHYFDEAEELKPPFWVRIRTLG